MEAQESLKVQELEDGSLQVGEAPEITTPPDGDEEDQRLNASSESEAGDEQGHAGETDEEAEARRQRNRERRQQNKQNRKDYIDSLRRELAARDQIINDLSTRVASVEQHSVGNQMAQIDAAIDEANRYYNHFKQINQQAIEQADGARAVDAQEKMFAAQRRAESLKAAKQSMLARTQQSKPLDPRMVSQAQSWMEKNPWYDANGEDADSDLTRKIDTRLVQEGWNPSTKEYWEELDARVKKYLPHRASLGYNKPQAPRVPVGGEGTPTARGTYRLSAERVQALKEAGIYDDPVKRADAIKRFQEYDRQHGQSN